MLEISILRKERERVLKGLELRNWAADEMKVVDQLIELDEKRRKFKSDSDELAALSNQKSREIGDLFKSGKRDEAEVLRAEVAASKDKAKELTDGLKAVEDEMTELLYTVPNIPNDLVPAGKSEADNYVFKDWGSDLPDLDSNAVPHWELAKKHELFDLELGVRITGAGFPVYTGKGAKLQRALISFFLDEATAAGYKEYQVPLLVNTDSATATGQLPDKEGQMYYVGKDDLYLIPTAEVPVTNIYRSELVEQDILPIKMCGYTPCFRREAGSYGAHVRGLNRVHQFDKVEIVQIVDPEKSYDALQEMLNHVEGLLQKLELPYRILRLCGGDLTFASALTYDFEVYSAAQKMWLEVSSVSNFETFQSNRLKLRYRGEKGNALAHTLNGSALALPRIVAALLENHQTENGIRIPKALQPYTGFAEIN